MSKEIKEVTNEEAMKILGEFATTCYNKGARDVLVGVGVGSIFSGVIIFGIELIDLWKDKNKTEKQIKEFNTFIKEEEES